MAKVKIKVRPVGAINGHEWPEVGDTIDLPDHVVAGMVASGHVEAVKAAEKPAKVETRPAPAKAVEKRGSRGRRNSG